VEVVASLSQGRTAAAQCGLFTHKSIPVIFEPPCILKAILVDFLSFLNRKSYRQRPVFYVGPHTRRSIFIFSIPVTDNVPIFSCHCMLFPFLLLHVASF